MSRFIRDLGATDDKYSHGVVGFVTGSAEFPGAALLGVTAAIRAGAGTVRFLGPSKVAELVLLSRPEVLTQDGRADAWVLGSGVTVNSESQQELIGQKALEPLLVIDAGALLTVDYSKLAGLAVLTPHAGELSQLLTGLDAPVSKKDVLESPEHFALLCSELTGCCVLLKGHTSRIAYTGQVLGVGPNSPALATAGSGDVLAGLLGSLLAQNHSDVLNGSCRLIDLVEFAVQLHSKAAANLAKTKTVAALDLTDELGELVAAERRLSLE